MCTPKIRFFDPLPSWIAEDPFGLRAHIIKAEVRGIGFPNNSADGVNQGVTELFIQAQYESGGTFRH
jgi:hypothetical protein